MSANYEALKLMYGELHIDYEAAQAEVRELRAALERARALLAKWGADAEQTGSWQRLDTLSDCADELSAALGSGGAA